MFTHKSECRTKTTDVPDFVDITDDIQNAVSASAIAIGRATVQCLDRGCALLVNERESGLFHDLRGAIARLRNANGTSATPIGSSSVVLPVAEGKLQLGVWQRVMLVELESPAERAVTVLVVGE